MDWQIRIAIAVVGIIVIAYVFYDFNKKKKVREKNERLKRQFQQDLDQLDSAGFDFTGVGSVRPANSSDSDSENDDVAFKKSNLGKAQSNNFSNTTIKSSEKTEEKLVSENESKAAFQVSENSDNAEPLLKDTNAERQPQLVLSFVLQANQGHKFIGKDFLPIFLSQGLRHGDMGIFHRYTRSGAEPGPVLFSLANGIAPGNFDISAIEKFETPALALFMTLPGPEDAQIAHNAMFKTIKLLKKELGGEILDESGNIYTEQTHNERLDHMQAYLSLYD